MTIFPIKKGDAPLPTRVIWRSREPVMRAQGWPQEDRDDVLMRAGSDPADPKVGRAMSALGQFNADLIATLKINEFNHQLAAWRGAATRLDRYPLAQGRAAIFEDQPTGEFDEAGTPIKASVMVQPAIDPLPAAIEVPTIDPETGEETGTELIANPAIEADEAERAAAQAVIDQTPQDVLDFGAAYDG